MGVKFIFASILSNWSISNFPDHNSRGAGFIRIQRTETTIPMLSTGVPRSLLRARKGIQDSNVLIVVIWVTSIGIDISIMLDEIYGLMG